MTKSAEVILKTLDSFIKGEIQFPVSLDHQGVRIDLWETEGRKHRVSEDLKFGYPFSMMADRRLEDVLQQKKAFVMTVYGRQISKDSNEPTIPTSYIAITMLQKKIYWDNL